MKRIGIVPVGRSAGAGLVSVLLASAAAGGEGLSQNSSRITMVELGRGNLYDQLCADRWFQLRPMISYWNCLHGEGRVERIANPHQGVNWLLRTPEDRDFSYGGSGDGGLGNSGLGEIQRERAVKLIYSLPGDVAFLDFSSVSAETLFYLLRDVDQVVAVIDPLPSKLIEGYERLCRLKLWQGSVCWVVNRFGEGIDGKELKRMLGLNRSWITLPEIPRRLLYQVEYGGCGLVESRQLREMMAPGVAALLKRLDI